MEHGDRDLAAHQKRDGDPDEKGPDDPLDHDKAGQAEAVEISDKAEQEAGQQTVNRVSLQIIGARGNDCGVLGEDPREQIAAPEGDSKHDHRQTCGDCDGITQGLFRPVVFPGSDILRDEGSHCLHEGGGDQHDEAADALRDADARGGDQPQIVDDGQQHQEGDPDQQVLEGDGQAQRGHRPDHGALEAEVLPFKAEGKLPPPQNQQREHHADRLGRHCSDGCSGGPHVEHRDQQEIPGDVADTGDQHRHQRGFGIPDTAEDAADQIVRDDEYGTKAADADIRSRSVKGLLRRIHNAAQRPRQQWHKNGQHRGNGPEQADPAAHHFAAVPAAARADSLAKQNGGPHGKAGHKVSDGHHHLRPGRHR